MLWGAVWMVGGGRDCAWLHLATFLSSIQICNLNSPIKIYNNIYRSTIIQ